MRSRFGVAVALSSVVAIALPTLLSAQAPPASPPGWTVPRLADGTPDFQGNWSNATMTPILRAEGRPLVLDPEQIVTMEGRRQSLIGERRPLPVGGDGDQ